MTDLEEYYYQRLVAEYNRIDDLEQILATQHEITAKLEDQIKNILGEDKLFEMYHLYEEKKK